jgi:mannose-6-phosphate isomerase-like protein (cupin superfamily)
MNEQHKPNTSSPRILNFPIVEKPWGREVLLDKNPVYAFKRIEMKAGTRSSLQSHRMKRETIYILSGRLELETIYPGQERRLEEYGPNEAYYLPAGVIHRVKVIEDCLLFEVSSPELDDLIRHDDDFGRT